MGADFPHYSYSADFPSLPRAGGQRQACGGPRCMGRGSEFRSQPQLTPFKSPPALIVQLSWELHPLAL